MKPDLTLPSLQAAASQFAEDESRHDEPKLFGVTDGKAVGTYLEGKFITLLAERFAFETGNAAKGIDLPGLQVDIKRASMAAAISACH